MVSISRSGHRPPPAKRSRSASSTVQRLATLSRRESNRRRARVAVKPFAPVLATAVQAKERKDDVKLGPAFTKLTEEDPSLTVVHNAENHEVIIWGQGEMHLRVARRGSRIVPVPMSTRPPTVGYRETIRKPITAAGKAQETIRRARPVRRRGPRDQAVAARIRFQIRRPITGGVVPRNYIPSVEEGSSTPSSTARLVSRWSICQSRWSTARTTRWIRPIRRSGPRGASASSRGCRSAARATRADPSGRDRLPDRSDGKDQCHPVGAPRPDISASIPVKAGRAGTRCARQMPEAEIGDLIIEVRSATAGVGSFILQVRSHGRAAPAAPPTRSSQQGARRSRPRSHLRDARGRAAPPSRLETSQSIRVAREMRASRSCRNRPGRLRDFSPRPLAHIP